MTLWHDRRLLDRFSIEHPILQSPMAGSATVELAAAVSNAGGLGGFGGAGASPDALRATVQQIRQLTDRPFNINLFDGKSETFDPSLRPSPALDQQLAGYHSELQLGPVPEPMALFGPVSHQLAVLIEERVPVISFHFGVDRDTVEQARSGGAVILSTATTVAEARILEANGVDAIIAQGGEAGGHRGTFEGNYRDALIGTMALVPRIVDEVEVPVIAAGGIMDARGIVAGLALGAAAVQIGTAFLGCPEARVPPVWRQALAEAEAEETTVTEVISGKPARGIRNRYVDELEKMSGEIMPYPAHYSMSRELRKEAVRRGDRDFAVMWAGQGVGLFRQEKAADLMAGWVEQARAIAERL
jgi:nitronate monooxygenase